MAKLIHEIWDFGFNDFQILNEEEEGKKKLKIKGPFIMAEERNKNGRIYKKPIIEREVIRFTNEKIKNKTALGELDHPETPTVSAKNAAIHIDELVMDGNIAIGKATLLNTPNGRIAAAILEDGYRLGVSSRGVGTLKENKEVGDNYKFITEDLVTDPSASKCYIESVLENKEYIIGEDGDIVEVAVENLKKSVDKNFDSKLALKYMLQFINDIKHKL